jgi:hypothetical protein
MISSRTRRCLRWVLAQRQLVEARAVRRAEQNEVLARRQLHTERVRKKQLERELAAVPTSQGKHPGHKPKQRLRFRYVSIHSIGGSDHDQWTGDRPAGESHGPAGGAGGWGRRPVAGGP